MKNEPCHTIVFRDVRQHWPGAKLHAELLTELRAVQSSQGENLENILISAFLRAGELECAHTDFAESDPSSYSSGSAKRLAQVSGLIAEALLAPEQATSLAGRAEEIVRQVECPAMVRVSPPEGFSFYALHPLDYVAVLDRIGLSDASPVLVVGIRSMGTTLSAIVCAALRKRVAAEKRKVERITVRPTGHPYDRTTALLDVHRARVLDYEQQNAIFLVVDEGPGLSGSSFLSVGDALHAVGVPRERIVFLCSRYADPETLVARDAARRWRTFNSYVVSPTRYMPIANALSISGGEWRHRLLTHSAYENSVYADPQNWPAVWPQVSPSKYLSLQGNGDDSGPTFFKYEGLGRYGAAVRDRAMLAADAGFSPRPTIAPNGFTAYPGVSGRLLSVADISSEMLQMMAEYLAFRARALAVDATETEMLKEMASFNYGLITGHALNGSLEFAIERPVIADARMMPYEWIKEDCTGRLIKLDCAAHGDNHFLPGPVDIAWDLAGTIVEWQLDRDAAQQFLQLYESASGDSPQGRLRPYVLAYAAFQAGYDMMAASALAGSDREEEWRLLQDYERYCGILVGVEVETGYGAKSPALEDSLALTHRTPQLQIPRPPVLQA